MRRLFWLVCLVLVIDTAFYAAITPLLPTYADDLDLSKTAAGVLSASYAAGTLAGALPGGWLAVRFGVKPTLLTGSSLLAVTSVVFGLAENVVILDVSRFFQGVGGACSWAASLAWLVGAAPRERRGQLIGGAIGAAIVGLLFGPVIGGAATEIGHRGGVRRRCGLRRRAGAHGRCSRRRPGRLRGGPARAGRRDPHPRRTCAPGSSCSPCPPCSPACSRCWCRCGSTCSAPAAWRWARPS